MTNKPTYKELEQRIKGLEQTEKALKERVKELGCISNLVKLVENSNTLEEVFTKFSTIIQPAMQHLDHVHSNLIVDGKTFYCKHGKLEIKPEWSYTSKIIVNDIKRGELIVFHDKDLTFLEEEKELCRILTERLEKVIERAETKQALKESERFFSQMFEQSIVSTQLLDPEGNTIKVNPPFCELFGVTPEDMKHYKILEDEAIKQSDAYEPLLDVFNNKNSRKWYNNFDIALASESSGVSTTKPETVWLENLSYPILDKNGNFLYAAIQHHNITEKVEADKALQASLKEKQTMIDEIHHRVKNNMQIMASLLSLQIAREDDERIKTVLRENRGRVFAMSAIHENLVISEHLSEIDFKSYLTKLCQTLLQTYSIEPKRITYRTESPNIKLNIDKANPLSLAVNELISNSLKYAFPEDREGKISVSMKKLDNELKLTVMDDGVGMPIDYDWKNSKSLGLKLVRTLVENQLDGSIDMESKHGTKFTIKFNIET